jgi:hypothetical protein
MGVHMSRILRCARSLALVILGGSSAACGSRATTSSVEAAPPIAECEAYAAAFETCVMNLGGADVTHAAAAKRTADMRAGLAAEATKDDAARAALRASCTAGIRELKASCH